jgi:hypothetical protein
MDDEKPRWAQTLEVCNRMSQKIEERKTRARAGRCGADSGGAQCTADAHPEHAHRWSREDLPS